MSSHPTAKTDRVAAHTTAQRHAFHVAMAIEAAIVLIGAFIYVGVRDLTRVAPERAVENARRLHSIEQGMGIDGEHVLNRFVIQHDSLRDLANWIYIWGHWPVIITVAAWLYIHNRDRYMWLRNAMFASGMIGFAFFAFVPMAPPRLAGLGYVDTITIWSSSYRVLQPPNHANIYAAMPSLHFGWDLLVGTALFLSTSFLVVRIAALMMPTLMAFAVIATANHWILDVVVGLCVVVAGVAASETLAVVHRRRARERNQVQRTTVRESA